MLFAPLEGWHHVAVRKRHTAVDYALILRHPADVHFPKADKITLVQDNLNTHKPASLYEVFPPAEARERFEWHYTPKHGSWLNIAECELSALARQCLDRRILIKPLWLPRSGRGKQHKTTSAQGETGNSQPRTTEPNSHNYTRKSDES